MVNKQKNVSVVSISLTSEMINELEKYKRELGFTGRSELIRAGIRAFVQKEKQKPGMTGKKSAVLTVVHTDKFDGEVTKIKYNFEHLIATQIHNNIEGDKCVEIFLMKGDAKEIEILTNDFRTSKKMDDVELLVL